MTTTSRTPRATLFIQDGKKSDARKVVESGLALLATEGSRPEKKRAGAYNALVDLATRNKLLKGLEYATKKGTGGSFRYRVPVGTGWKSGGYGFTLSGDRVLNLTRGLDKEYTRISISAYDWNIHYMDGSNSNGAGGSNLKALSKMLKMSSMARIDGAKARGASKSELPRWVRKANGFAVDGASDGRPSTAWCWVFKSVKDRQLSYALVVEVVGQSPKKAPRRRPPS